VNRVPAVLRAVRDRGDIEMTSQATRLLLALAVAACAGRAAAGGPAAQGHLGLVGELDLEYGGDNVARVYYEDGSTQDVKAGQGGTLAVGAHYRPGMLRSLDVSGTLGYKFVTTAASNAHLGITRWVVQVLAVYDPVDQWWVGGGPVVHLGTRFSGDGLTSDVDFGSSLGFTVQGGWRWVGITYTHMEYKAFGAKVDASAIGATLRWRG
jgi:hypothetical protein